MDTYSEAHLFVAAIRILSHQKGWPPSVEDVCAMLGVSDEAGHRICRDLQKRKIIETMVDPYSIKLSVADHLELEKISREEDRHNNLSRELEKFLQEKRKKEKSAAEIQTEMDKKKRDMLADIEAKFKKEMEKFKKS
jgi:hypothetical protein